MNYCFHCGKELPQGYGFCPHCGKSSRQAQAVPTAKSKIDGGIRGRSIASIILGGEGLVGCFGTLILLVCEFMVLLILALAENTGDETVIFAILYFYIFFIAIMSIGFSIAGKILASKVLGKLPYYTPAVIGNKLNLAGLIISAVSIVAGLIPLLVSLS